MVTTAGATPLTTSAYERTAPALSAGRAGGSATSSRSPFRQDCSEKSARTAAAAQNFNARSFLAPNILTRNLNYRRRRVSTVWRRGDPASYIARRGHTARSPDEQGLLGNGIGFMGLIGPIGRPIGPISPINPI